MAKKRKTRVKHGHPISLLIGLHDDRAVFWRIFSETIRLEIIIKRGRKRKFLISGRFLRLFLIIH